MKEKKEVVSEKPKDIVGRHMTDKGFRIDLAFLEQEAMIKDLNTRLVAMEEAIAFFANWYNKTQETNILIPDTLKDELDGKSKLIL